MAVSFPSLTRAPQMDVEESWEDSTIRDKMENGAMFARPRFQRMRRTFKLNYKACTATDRDTLRSFVTANGGWAKFAFVDDRVSTDVATLNVRFSKLPTYKDGGLLDGEKRFDISFEITEV